MVILNIKNGNSGWSDSQLLRFGKWVCKFFNKLYDHTVVRMLVATIFFI